MQGKTRSQKPNLILGLNKVTRRRKLSRISEVVEVDVRLESCLNVEPNINPLLETLEVEVQLEKEATPSKLSGDTSSETHTFREEILVGIDREIEEDTPVTMAKERRMDPLPIPPMPRIDPLESSDIGGCQEGG